MSQTVYTYEPVGLDKWERKGPEWGTQVVKVQPAGTPRNGTMGHCYIADAKTGEFYGLRLENSLVRIPSSKPRN
jgi:hypothetical protein